MFVEDDEDAAFAEGGAFAGFDEAEVLAEFVFGVEVGDVEGETDDFAALEVVDGAFVTDAGGVAEGDVVAADGVDGGAGAA